MSFGYFAAIWQQAAGSVFSEIGEPADMYISPPCGLVGDSLEDYLDEMDFTGNSHENIPNSNRYLRGLFLTCMVWWT